MDSFSNSVSRGNLGARGSNKRLWSPKCRSTNLILIERSSMPKNQFKSTQQYGFKRLLLVCSWQEYQLCEAKV
ncbi:hypothetical protein GDO81_001295 [Engystomops pustulosus]|uniref:Uncharacterized protein n=1 Tax=Engystomops pustulosus TaxID=76066 RepID=A0AAV7DES7_ENGPU|nr:hypothetical protein GDO81_001295 [Engystomops pustulosus]